MDLHQLQSLQHLLSFHAYLPSAPKVFYLACHSYSDLLDTLLLIHNHVLRGASHLKTSKIVRYKAT